MAKTRKIMSAREVYELRWNPKDVNKKGYPMPTPYCVGGAERFWINVTNTGGKSWVYRYSFDGKRSKMGIGSYTYQASEGSEALTLKKARELAANYNGILAQGKDPLTERDRLKRAAIAEKAKAVTFKEYTEKNFVPLKEKKYKSAGQVRRLKQLLRDYIYPAIGHISIPIEKVEPGWKE